MFVFMKIVQKFVTELQPRDATRIVSDFSFTTMRLSAHTFSLTRRMSPSVCHLMCSLQINEQHFGGRICPSACFIEPNKRACHLFPGTTQPFAWANMNILSR
jgi:hypothetical protein